MRRRPTEIKHLNHKKIVQISAGHGFSLVLSFDGIIYSFGLNSHSQLGLGDRIDRNIPYQVDYFKGLNITQIMAGSSSFVVTHIYCFNISYLEGAVCSGNGVCSSFNNCTCHGENLIGEQCKKIINFRYRLIIPLYFLIIILLLFFSLMLVNDSIFFYEKCLKRNPFKYYSDFKKKIGINDTEMNPLVKK